MKCAPDIMPRVAKRRAVFLPERWRMQKSKNICKAIRDGKCPFIKAFPKFQYFTCADQKNKIFSVKNEHALLKEYRGTISWGSGILMIVFIINVH